MYLLIIVTWKVKETLKHIQESYPIHTKKSIPFYNRYGGGGWRMEWGWGECLGLDGDQE